MSVPTIQWNKLPLKVYAGIAALFFIIVYLAWSLWGARPPTPGQGFQPTKPAVSTEKVSGPAIKSPIKIVPKKKVAQKYPEAVITESEEWVDTAKVPPAPNGAVVLTKVDTVTGEVTSQVEINKAPWFAFERSNTLGVGYEIGTQGAKIPIYYRRDILRIKDIHLLAEVGAKIAVSPAEKSEAHGAVLAEWRF
jgi:hypothetical protein